MSDFYDWIDNLPPGKSVDDATREMLNEEFQPALIIKDAPDWISESLATPDSKQLFGSLWFENEVCILFGDTGTGKSVLAYQIADSLSTGQPTPLAPLQTEAQKVLYLDCELSGKQIAKRFSDENKEQYPLSRNLKRAELNAASEPDPGVDYETHIANAIEKGIISSGASILIVDNITYLKSETEKAKDASSLMKQLKALSDTHKIAILVLAHTPKRDLSKPLDRNDLAGSKMLINFCDSAFAIGESTHDRSLRYLKQIKVRNTEEEYGANNVILCAMRKDPHSFLSFHYVSQSTEQEHLKEWTKKEKENKKLEAKELSEQGYSLRQIADKLDIGHNTVKRYLDEMNEL